MFSLIVTVVSIALVAALALASIYYGSRIADEAGAKARATTLVNQGEQITAAARLFYTEQGHTPSSLAQLVETGYLNSIPVPVGLQVAKFSLISEAYAADATWTWDAPTQSLALVRAVSDGTVCAQVNRISFDRAVVEDAVDTRFRVQCYGDAPSYTVIWNANTDLTTQVNNKPAVCQGTENVSHIPATCGANVVEGTASALPTPPVVASPFGDYLNALGPVNNIPDLPTGWYPETESTCSNPMSATTNPVPLEYVVTSPGDALLTVKFLQGWSFQGAVDYAGLGYALGYSTATRVLVNGEVVYDQATDPYNPQEIETTPLMVAKGTHVVRIESTVRAVLMDGMTYMELPWTEEVPAPSASTCVSQFQNAAVVKQSGTGALPPAGQLSVTGSCEVDALPYLARTTIYNFYCPAPGGTALWGTLQYSIAYSNVSIKGTKETLDGLNLGGTAVGSVFADGPLLGTPGVINTPTAYLYGECAALGNTSSYEAISGVSPIASKAIRVSDTELWVPSASALFVRGNQPLNGDSANYVTNNQDVPYAKNLTLALLSGGAVAYGPPPPLSTLAISSLACSSKIGRSLPLNSWRPSCSVGFTWSDKLGQCVCQPSATTVCPTPNAGLTGDITNTSPKVKCTMGALASASDGKCIPMFQ